MNLIRAGKQYLQAFETSESYQALSLRRAVICDCELEDNMLLVWFNQAIQLKAQFLAHPCTSRVRRRCGQAACRTGTNRNEPVERARGRGTPPPLLVGAPLHGACAPVLPAEFLNLRTRSTRAACAAGQDGGAQLALLQSRCWYAIS